MLEELLRARTAVGSDAQARYDESLARLRERAEDAIVEIARAEGTTDPRDYPRRLALIHAAAELRDRSALPYLSSIVMTPIPPEEAPDPHTFSTVAEETILRTTAVEGLERLAVAGSAAALDALFASFEQPSLSVRRAAVQAILATTEGDVLRARLSERLPADQRFLLDIQRVSVGDVPQVRDPRVHLAEDANSGASIVSPLLPEDRSAEQSGRDDEPPTRR